LFGAAAGLHVGLQSARTALIHTACVVVVTVGRTGLHVGLQSARTALIHTACVIIMTVGRTVEHLKKELQQKGDIGLVAEVRSLRFFMMLL